MSPTSHQLSPLQECYGLVLYEAVVEALMAGSTEDPAQLLQQVHQLVGGQCKSGSLISLLHSYLMHSNIGLLLHLPQ